MPWEENQKTIRSGHKNPQNFQPDTQKTISLNENEGIQAVVAKPLDKTALEIESYIFDKAKGWTLEKAKAWFNQYHPAKEHLCAVLPFVITEKLAGTPLKIHGLAMTAGMSRNFNIYTPKELEAFSDKLIEAPVYLEHVSAQNAVGKVTRTE